jgi:hypothetical protein
MNTALNECWTRDPGWTDPAGRGIGSKIHAYTASAPLTVHLGRLVRRELVVAIGVVMHEAEPFIQGERGHIGHVHLQ